MKKKQSYSKKIEKERKLNNQPIFCNINYYKKYVGWTAQKVHDTVEKAIGGVLFIDEAYSLVSNTRGSFEDEAIATLIKVKFEQADRVILTNSKSINSITNKDIESAIHAISHSEKEKRIGFCS